MALVLVQGQFLGASLKKSTFDGNTKFSVQIDVYQPDSPVAEKTVTIKEDNHEALKQINDQYKMGDPISCLCTVNAYRNDAYFKLAQIIA